MNIKHCVSFELAKQLKEAGYLQETEFYWCDKFPFVSSVPIIIDKITREKWKTRNGSGGICFEQPVIDTLMNCIYSAPIATELLEALPREVSIKQYPENDSVRYQVGHNADKMALQTFKYSNNLCDALAEMWLYRGEKKVEMNKEICEEDIIKIIRESDIQWNKEHSISHEEDIVEMGVSVELSKDYLKFMAQAILELLKGKKGEK